MSFHAIVLAAGKGTRMKSALPKVLHAVAGRPMIAQVVATARAAGAATVRIVHGHGGDQVRDWFAAQDPKIPLLWVEQAVQRGTGDAVRLALDGIDDNTPVVVLYGDVPLVPVELVTSLVAAATSARLALVGAKVDDPSGYGRLLRDVEGRLLGIVEHKDANPVQRHIHEINTGLLAAQAGALRRWLSQIGNANANGEFYLTDVVALAVADGLAPATIMAPDFADVEGVNDPLQLARAERRFQQRNAAALQRDGLYLADPSRFDLRGSLTFGRDVHVDIGCIFEGKVTLGDNVRVGPYCVLRDVSLGAGTQVNAHSVLDGAAVGSDGCIGPFARLRPGAQLANGVHIGNFVEIKQSTLGAGSKANHLAYVGDATVGANVNIGAGVITCNYDGVDKHRTVIGDNAFIGSDSQLIAPVTVGDNAYIAAGSTIVKDAPAGQLTVRRPREQRSIPWTRPTRK